jgi:periplasmic copper chaperone A
VQPKAGWTYQTTPKNLPTPVTNDDGQQVTQYTSEIAWTGGQIKPGEFDTFVISVGTLPGDVDSLTFPVVQSYDNGQDVSWIDPTVEGQPEPEHPAPVLHLTAAADASGSATSDPSSSSSTSPAVAATVVKKETNNTLGIIALIVGALGLIFGAVALARSRAGRGAQT